VLWSRVHEARCIETGDCHCPRCPEGEGAKAWLVDRLCGNLLDWTSPELPTARNSCIDKSLLRPICCLLVGSACWSCAALKCPPHAQMSLMQQLPDFRARWSARFT